MTSSAALSPGAGAAERERRRRIAFFFHDYLDPEARILELAPEAGALEPYLKEAGFHRYLRLDREAPADRVGDVRAWRALGLSAASFDVVLALDLLPFVVCEDACHELLVAGGLLFATAPLPGRRRLARALAALGLGPAPGREPLRPVDLARLSGFELLALRRRGFVEQWARLRKPLGP